ncbi:MAG TPA: CapA family protein [Candidatus Dormibacteraeota bacterium]|nr:CapA family protein [Candidatus Dormibacteraeota bacterium]
MARSLRLLLALLFCGSLNSAAQDFTLTLTGDSIITQRVSVHQTDAKFMNVVNAVREGDAAFTNLEILFHDYEFSPAAQSGGTWLRADPALLKELQWMGFNLFATANNHSLDYGIDGLRNHRRILKEHGAVFAGTGEHLGEARSPAYLETAHGRIALVSCASTFSPGSPAGAQRSDLRGRPGLNPLRYRTRYRVDAAQFSALRKMKQDLKLVAADVLSRAEPDSPERLTFLGQTFELSDTRAVVTEPEPRDLHGLTAAIREARRMADYVLVSIHAHEGAPDAREVPAQFLVEFAHAAIEAGADVFVGHGPHVLRGIELYKGKVIFYSLSNFIFQNDTVTHLPADIYEQFDLSPDALPSDLYEARSDHDRRGFAADPLHWESVIARVTFRRGTASEVRLTPIGLGFGRSRWQRGSPESVDQESSTRILERLQKLSQPFSTKIEIRNGQGIIHTGR